MGDDVYLIDEWLRFANMDLDLAKHSFATMHPAPLEIICYHCQQTAEKFLKGVIIAFDDEPEKTHDLLKIITVLKRYIDFPVELERFGETLTLYGVRTRYPDAISVDEDQTKLAIAQAEKIKILAEKVIAEKNDMQSGKEENTIDTTTD
ncbi:MAG: HEPN domain-containing protein [Spirochaetales bacterium]|nr:HEPN domain-containing protein [Spirochaetales bacterium]